MQAAVAFYSGSFDPPTNGHLAVVAAALLLAERVVVGVGAHPTKSGLFSPAERLAMIRDCLAALPGTEARTEATTFQGLVVDAARDAGATLIVRGLRDGTDFDYEMQMAGMNRAMAPRIQTVFVPASPETRSLSATLVRQIAGLGGDIRPFVPALVAAKLEAKFAAKQADTSQAGA